MRLAALIVLTIIFGCGEAGPRDRSLMLRVSGDDPGSPVPSPRRPKKKRAATSVIGLVTDPLAQFYAEGASVIVRFENMTSLMREAAPRLAEVAKALPGVRLPKGAPAALLRKTLRLPKSVVFDSLRPFALVKTKQGWAAIVPTRTRKEAQDRLRALDGIYCVAGTPSVVDKYRPGMRKGFYLPGDCSVIAKPEAVANLGTALTQAFGSLGIDLAFLDSDLRSMPADIERIDLAVRFTQGGLRCDVRLAPNRESATARFLERMKPRASSVVNWLPSDGTAYLEFGTKSLEWEVLLVNLLRDTVQVPDAVEAPGLHALRKGLSVLGGDFAAMLDLDPDGAGRAFLIGTVDSNDAAHAYLASRDFAILLKHITGPGGHLEWMPNTFKHGDLEVGAVTGHISRKRLTAWRDGSVIDSTMSILLRGPVVAYVAVIDSKICAAVGQRARVEIERLIDRIASGKAGGNKHSAEVDPLFRSRLASASVDLAALFDGCREAAPFWHENGRALRKIALRWRLPAAAAVTVEGGALRLGLRVRPRMLANAAAKILQALSKGDEENGK